jgi:HSP20 family molecular chaperone IbpA
MEQVSICNPNYQDDLSLTVDFEAVDSAGSSTQSAQPISAARFSRSVQLPRPVDGTKVTAKLVDGILTITIPKTDDHTSIRIPID